MKKIVALLMASAMAASLAACGGSTQSSEATSAAPAESTAAESTATDGKKYEGVELTMWSMWSAGEVQANAIQAAADAFEAETGAHVNIEWKGRDVNTLISAALESGEKLDIFEDDYNRIGHAYAPYTYDLTEMANAVGYDDFSYACFNDQSKEWAGYLNSIVEQPQIGGIFYNKDVFDACGITETPKTWDEFLTVCQTIKDNGYEPLALDGAYANFNFYNHKHPNIILLMADQMRGDCLGIAGHPDVKTPFLDALAAEGVRYENAYSACPTCVPARASLYTGMSQEHTGRVGYEDLVPWNYTHTLAGELSKAGYYTQCVGKMHVHPLRNNLGFNDVRLHDGYLHAYRRPSTPSYEDQRVADDYYWWLKQQLGVDADPVDTGLDCNSWVVRPWIYEEKYHPTNWVASECRDFLRRRDRSKPFFLMASFVRPHPPLDAPEYYLNLYKDKPLAEPWRGDWNDCVRWERDGHSYHGTV